jgi:ethanolamine utilization protein EutQ (cupin superfamily)
LIIDNEIKETEEKNESITSNKVEIGDRLEQQAEGESKRTILTNDDWDLILNGAKHVKYNDGDVIIKAGFFFFYFFFYIFYIFFIL